jgi:branched-chain amino acid transport system permease protein
MQTLQYWRCFYQRSGCDPEVSADSGRLAMSEDFAVESAAVERKSEMPGWRRFAIALLSGRRVSLSVPLVLAVVAILLPTFVSSSYWIQQLSLIAVYALVVSGVNLSFGYAGELQLGQVFMFAFGAYLTMILAVEGVTTNVILLMLIGGFAAVIVGAFVAAPSLRIGGWALAMVSFFLVITIPDWAVIFQGKTGGLNGLTGIPFPSLFGHQLGNNALYEVAVVAAILWFAVYRNLVTSRYGVVFRVLRESPVLTRSLGYSPPRMKTGIYALGAFPAGMAGCLFGFISLIVDPSTFGLQLGIGVVAASVLGGTESVYGVFIGAAVLVLGPEESTSFSSWAPVAYGVFLILAATLLRGGAARLGKIAAARTIRLLQGPYAEELVVEDAAHIEGEPHTPHAVDPHSNGQAALDVRTLPKVTGKRITISEVSRAFGGVKALRDVSLTAEPGAVTGLIGSNGSGKTTLLNAISGYIKTDAGSVSLGEDTISGLRPEKIARLGVGRTFQTPTIPRGVTVRDVVASGRYSIDHVGFLASVLRLPRYRSAQRNDRREAAEILRLAGIGHMADQEAASLSLGTRRLVEVSRALCARPSVMLLDEPASGLSDEEVHDLARLVAAMAEAGTTVVVVEHNFRFVTSVSNTIHVLHLGELIASGTPDEVAGDRRVIESYLGESSAQPRVRTRPTIVDGGDGPASLPGERLLELDGIEAGYGDLKVVRGVSMSVAKGSIEVILGRNGVGKTTLLSTISGLLPTDAGTITFDGQAVNKKAPYTRTAAGISMVQEGKRIFRSRTVWENVILGTHPLRMSRQERTQFCNQIIARFPALEPRRAQRAGGLSGGQQQMLAIARALASRPQILLLDEPSAGLAPSIVDELFGQLRRLADEGLTILLVEQLADKALAIADHVTVLDAGKVTDSGEVESFADLAKLEAAYGLL